MEKQGYDKERSGISHLAYYTATILGAGRLPLMPGTWGSLVVLPLYLLLGKYELVFFIITLILLIISIPVSTYVAKRMKKKDPSVIVIDEFVGQMIALLFIPEFGIKTFIIAFLLFRICDIIKPPPANISQKLYLGWGVVIDDVVAGVYANLILQIIMRVL